MKQHQGVPPAANNDSGPDKVVQAAITYCIKRMKSGLGVACVLCGHAVDPLSGDLSRNDECLNCLLDVQNGSRQAGVFESRKSFRERILAQHHRNQRH